MDRKVIEECLNKAGLTIDHMNVQKYELWDDFYENHDEVFESSEYWFEDIEVDFDIWFHNECPRIPTDAEISEEILDMSDVEYTSDMINKIFSELPEDVKIDLNDWFDSLEFNDFVDSPDIQINLF